MGRRHSRGFTLIELLVVIAIIAILAAMLFPVFARARESARKIQCLGNVKNIAMAFQMYLTDYDRMPPGEHDQGAQAFFDTAPGGGTPQSNCDRSWWLNPYIRFPVVLDEYIKNRDVWKCPSAKFVYSPYCILPGYGGVWWQYLRDHQGQWGSGDNYLGCQLAYPTGWGGDVTDSIAQQEIAYAGTGGYTNTRSFEYTIQCAEDYAADVQLSSMPDPSGWIVVADGGTDYYLSKLDRSMQQVCTALHACGTKDCANCNGQGGSGCGGLSLQERRSLATDPVARGKYARHLGGSNLGFADGHAQWWPTGQVYAAMPWRQCCAYPDCNSLWHQPAKQTLWGLSE